MSRLAPDQEQANRGGFLNEINAMPSSQPCSSSTQDVEIATTSVPVPSMSFDTDSAFAGVEDTHCQAERELLFNDEDTDDSDDDNQLNLNPPSFGISPRVVFSTNPLVGHLPDPQESDKTCVILYEENFSQGKFGGRNGSNACTFICIIFAKLYHNKNIVLIDNKHYRYQNSCVERDLAVAMEQGNRLYDYCRKSLPHRYCSVEEVADQLSSICPFTVREEIPVWITNEHYASTLKGQLEFFMMFGEYFVAIFTCNEKTSIFCYDKIRIAFLDTHTHRHKGETGGAIYIAAQKGLED